MTIMRFWLSGLLAVAVAGCGDDSGGSNDAVSTSDDASTSDGASMDGTDESGGSDDVGIGSVTMRDVVAQAQAFVAPNHTGCALHLVVAQSIESDGTVATPTPETVVGWSVSFMCDGEAVTYNDLSSAAAPYETVGPVADDAITFAIDVVPDSPSIMADYADAGCTPVAGEVFDSMRVSGYSPDGTTPQVLVFVGSSAGDWSGIFDTTGLVQEPVPCM